MKRLVFALLLLLFLLLALSLSVVVVLSGRVSFWGRALGPPSYSGDQSVENSYLFASPLRAQAGAGEKIRVTVFVLNGQGNGVPGQKVFLGEDSRLTIFPPQATTDNYGMATFDISALMPGEYVLEARVEDKILPKTLTITFSP